MKKETKSKIAAILIRSGIEFSQGVKDTLKKMGLKRKNACTIMDNTPSNLGMMRKAKDLITWGELNDEVLELIKDKKVIHLHPPRGGFERKGIKVPFKVGGALGYRGDKINDLIKRMMP